VYHDEDQGVAAQRRKLLNGGVELPHRHRIFLARRLKHDPINFLEGLEPEPPLAEAGDVEVAKNGEDPSLEVAPRLELVHRGDRANQGILYQVVRPIVFAAQNARKCSQVRKELDQAGAKLIAPIDFGTPQSKHSLFLPSQPSASTVEPLAYASLCRTSFPTHIKNRQCGEQGFLRGNHRYRICRSTPRLPVGIRLYAPTIDRA
jgi:hypothetical protein